MEKNKTQRLPAPKKSPKLQPQCVSYSEAASGLHTSYQGTDARANLPGSPYKPPTSPTPTQGGGFVGRGTPRDSRGVFLSIFFLRRRRKNMAPGGRQPFCMENIKTQKPASQKKSPKLQPQCVSYSEAASVQHTRYRARMHSQICLVARTIPPTPPTPTQGVGP